MYWILITFGITLSTASAIEQSVWMPTCPTSSKNHVLQHSDDCRKFFICVEGIAYPMSCPYGLGWNPSLNKCTTLSNCTNKEQRIRLPKYNPLCPLDEDPANPTHLPDQNDCQNFYECAGGFAFPMECPDGHHWSPEYENCVDPGVANCQYPTEPIENGLLNSACPINDDPSYPTHLLHPNDCRKFYKCSFGRSYIFLCPYGQHWNADASRCDSPFKAQCAMSKLTTLPAKTSPASYITDKNANLPICPDSGVKNFAIPGQCDKFFSCRQGKLYLMPCREGRQWSDAVRGCITSSLAGCTGIAPGVTVTTSRPNLPLNVEHHLGTTSTPSTAIRPTSCAPGVDFLPHPRDCRKFFMCDNGKSVERLCPSGLFFSYTTRSCEWSDNDC